MAKSEIRQRAIALLARREHSVRELSRKLVTKGFDEPEVNVVVDGLRKEGLVSDQRFTESFVRMRVERGYGPVRIRQELRERGVDGETVDIYLSRAGENWQERIAAVWEKRFGASVPADFRERTRQVRFLLYRGFESEQIWELFRLAKQRL